MKYIKDTNDAALSIIIPFKNIRNQLKRKENCEKVSEQKGNMKELAEHKLFFLKQITCIYVVTVTRQINKKNIIANGSKFCLTCNFS